MRRGIITLGLVAAMAVSLVAGSLAAGAAELEPGGTFIDDDGSVHEGSIEAIAAAGITRSCNPPVGDRFCPSDAVTRGQMAAFLVRALELPEASGDSFTDDDNSEFEGDIERLAAAGITRGCSPTAFCPDDPITRGQMAAFLVRAYGYLTSDEDRFTDDDSSVFESDINALAASGITVGCDDGLFCPDDRVTRDQMATFITRAEGLTPIVPPSRPEARLVEVASGLNTPVHATAPGGDDRLFIVQKTGVISILDGDSVLAEPFLDISAEVDDSGNEMGLLSMAFHPQYSTNGRFFVYYSRAGGNEHHVSRIAEYTVSADANVAQTTEREILTIPQPYSNHNGGHILFGPDGMLYIALGDGGGGGDPDDNGQDRATLLGSILRIDIDSADRYAIPATNPYVGTAGEDEIWAIGLRNPWRIWFDDDLLYVADVGQGQREEISVVAADEPGVNYGWNTMEGSICHDPATGCSTSGLELPLVEHTHASGFCSITGGVVYRGSELPQLRGRYLYADLCEGRIRTLLTDGASVLEQGDLTGDVGEVGGIWSFATDGRGEVYVLRGSNGTVLKLSAG
ncbi:MAG: PQQ-dependent sugar dehydrogenase [Acidimicrobiia bacterium]